jgi:hypothetical protein
MRLLSVWVLEEVLIYCTKLEADDLSMGGIDATQNAHKGWDCMGKIDFVGLQSGSLTAIF